MVRQRSVAPPANTYYCEVAAIVAAEAGAAVVAVGAGAAIVAAIVMAGMAAAVAAVVAAGAAAVATGIDVIPAPPFWKSVDG